MREIEEKIFQRFDEVGVAKLEENLEHDNFELQQILTFLGKPLLGRNKLLDIGSGKGRFAARLKERGFEVTGVEPAIGLLNAAQRLHPGIKFIQASVTDLPFSDEIFDCAICVEVIEHIPDTELAIREMARVLKPGGKLIVIDKNIRSLHHLYFVPTVIWKWWREITGRWMYPPGFPFREKYFVPASLNRQLAQYFAKVDSAGLQFKPQQRDRSWGLNLIWWIHRRTSGLLHRLLPGWDFYYVWRATK